MTRVSKESATEDSGSGCSDREPTEASDQAVASRSSPRTATLDRRADEMRGLDDGEREWIARSMDAAWQSFEYDRQDNRQRNAPVDRPIPKPTPVSAVMGVGPDDADRLASGGITSAERLATIDAFTIATVLDLDVVHVRSWRHNARELIE